MAAMFTINGAVGMGGPAGPKFALQELEMSDEEQLKSKLLDGGWRAALSFHGGCISLINGGYL